MSGKHPPRPRYRFCWWCSRKLHGNAHRVVLVDGRERIVHTACVEMATTEDVAFGPRAPERLP